MNSYQPKEFWLFTKGGMATVIVGGFLALAAIVSVPQMVENLDANDLMVLQSPIEGNLSTYTEPGVKWQTFGKVTKYPRRSEYRFTNAKDMAADSGPKKLRFNDGGHADLSGAISWEMPLEPEAILKIHKKFGSAQAVEQQVVARMVDNAVYLAGPLMSSTESSGERRAELVQHINDQAENGVYVTRNVEKEVVDPITGVKKVITATEIVRDEKGLPRRQQGSLLAEFKINLLPLSIQDLKYDKVVEDQIAQRQKATTEVQIAQANAKKAEQDAITIAKQGEAKAAATKWEQEAVKAKEVTHAQQKLEVATLAAKEAEQYKREQILRGEGDAAARRLVMEADGALDKKLQAYVDVQKAWAEAYAKNTTQQVPSVIMGGNGSAPSHGQGGAQTMMDAMAVKALKDLGTEIRASGVSNTAKK
jgi:regulator of protease activity HflC (stomatin/prohibitin superfamily)